MQRLRNILCVLLLSFTASASANWIEKSDAISLQVLELEGAYWPEDAAGYGLNQFDTHVADLGKKVHQRYLKDLRAQLADLKKLRSQEQDTQVAQDIDILIAAVSDSITSAELEHKLLLPYYNLHELVFYSIKSLLDPRNEKSRYPAALERLRKYNGSADGYESITSQAIARSSERFPVSGLVGPYRGELETDQGKREAFITGTRELLADSGLAGWEEDFTLLQQQLDDYAQWVDANIVPRARQNNQLPVDIYVDRLKNYGVNATPGELIAKAQYSYQLLRSEMKALALQIAEQRGWKDKSLLAVIAALKNEQIPAEKVLATYQQRLAELEQIIVREDIVSLPQRDASIRLATAAESAAIPAPFMSPPQLLNNTGQYGEFVLVQSNPALGDDAKMDDWSHYAMTWALTAHEARPGHELQFARLVEDGTSMARAIYASNSANSEGWGLYAESIMHEYLPLEGQLFNLYTRAMRAARMFLDPMVNTGQLSRDAAKAFLVEQLLMSPPMASSEADRYAFWAPGQATSYYYGYMSLMRLRTEVELAMGSNFNQRKFHDFILRQGLLPPDLLRSAVLDEFVR